MSFATLLVLVTLVFVSTALWRFVDLLTPTTPVLIRGSMFPPVGQLNDVSRDLSGKGAILAHSVLQLLDPG